MTFVKGEKSAAAWFWRILLGYAALFDGIVLILTLGFISPSLTLPIARRISMARFTTNLQSKLNKES